MCTRYNVEFNAKNSYIEGQKIINDANKDDFTTLINLFPITNSGGGAVSQMERTIEKCRKAIKKHSITKKPKRDSKKARDAKYQYFYNQEEYVHGVKRAWILLGKAELHKGDFLGAASTFSYIQRHYPSDNEIVCEARIWQARAYSEMDWLYEALEVFEKIDEDNVTPRLNNDYALTKAFLLLKSDDINNAIPYLQIAAKKSKGKFYTSRYNYLLGQIYWEQANKAKAGEHFRIAARQAPTYPMVFNARLMMLQCEKEKWKKSVMRLEKMLKSPNNKEYQGQIHTTIGNIYLQHEDTTQAIEHYKAAIEKSTRSGIEKAIALITLGDIFYNQKKYIEAHPCYADAATLLSAEHDDYNRVSKLGETLGIIATAHETVVLQDSLQHLATLSAEEQEAIVNKIIEDVKKREEEEAKKAEEEATKGFVETEHIDMGNANIDGNASWYFYNPRLVQQGVSAFRRKWGNRKLEDNWRRANKSAPLFASNDETSDEENNINSDSTLQKQALSPDIPQHHQPAYYLNQIPKTPEEIAASDQLIADALYTMAETYDSKLRDFPAAAETYDLCRMRFPSDKRTLEGLYASYRIARRRELSDEETMYRQQIIDSFPDSKYAAMLSQPNYIEHAQAMLDMQDSLYSATYIAYTKGDLVTVHNNYQYMSDTYPLSSLMPKFTFLHTMAIGKVTPGTPFRTELNHIIETYPQSDVTPICKDILALMGQGVEAQESKTTTTLADKRNNETEKSDSTNIKQFVLDKHTAYHLLLIPHNEANTDFNSLLYDVAAFNFTKFMIKDFDISHTNLANTSVIDISQLESADEAHWYEAMLLAEPTLQGRVTLDKIERIIISDENMGLIREGRSLDDYRQWWEAQQKENTTKKQKSEKHNITKHKK